MNSMDVTIPKPTQGTVATVNWDAMKKDIKESVSQNIQDAKDIAKEKLMVSVDPVVDAGCMFGQSLADKAISENAPLSCAPIIIKGVNSAANAIAPYIKNGINVSIDKSVNYSAQKSMDACDSIIEKIFDSFGNNTVEEVKFEKEIIEEEKSYEALDIEFDSDSEQQQDNNVKKIIQ